MKEAQTGITPKKSMLSTSLDVISCSKKSTCTDSDGVSRGFPDGINTQDRGRQARLCGIRKTWGERNLHSGLFGIQSGCTNVSNEKR